MKGNQDAGLALPMQNASLPQLIMSAPKSPLVDPKELVPAVAGFALGLGIIAFFVLLSYFLGQTLLVNHADIPHQ